MASLIAVVLASKLSLVAEGLVNSFSPFITAVCNALQLVDVFAKEDCFFALLIAFFKSSLGIERGSAGFTILIDVNVQAVVPP